MPLYEYQCKKCKHRFEKIQLFSDRPIKKCPSCGESAVEKLLSAPAVHFKGSGFYQTDYAKKPSPESSSSTDSKAEGQPSSGQAGAGTTSDSKTGGDKTSEASSKSKSEKSSSASESKPAAEPKGDPRGRSTHSKKTRKK